MKIKTGFTLRTVMGQHIVLAEGNATDSYGKIINFNASAAMLWNELKGKEFTTDDAASLLITEYGLDPAQAQADAAHFVASLTRSKLLDA